MVKNAFKHPRHGWLFPGSEALRLHQAGENQALDKHMREVEARFQLLTYGQPKLKE